MSEYEVGVTAPPFHCNCRSAMVPYDKEIDEMMAEDEGISDTRMARDPVTGKSGRVNDMDYKEWYSRYVVENNKALIKEKAYKNNHKDRAQYVRYREILGYNKIGPFDKFQDLKYNKSVEWEKFRAYARAIKLGELTPLADFNLYLDISYEVDEKLIGITTSNGIKIVNKSDHLVARIIGSIEQRRNGVHIDDVFDALTKSESKIFPINEFENGKSQKFRNNTLEVSVNPSTGNIIQVNPIRVKKRR